MLGFSPKLPVSEEDRLWVDDGFRRLERMLGRKRMLEARVILPTQEDFPDPYDKTPGSAEVLFRRVCGYMKVESKNVDLEIFADEVEPLREILPYWRSSRAKSAAGLYVAAKECGHREVPADGEKAVVAIRSTQLGDPMVLVATVAHELGHVILLGGRLLSPETSDHEPMTDLLTVFLGLGIFTANSAARFRKFQDDRRQGWSMERLGYLPEEVYGYASAKFAVERGEAKPEWAKFLSTNVREYFKRSRSWLAKYSSGFDGTLASGPEPL